MHWTILPTDALFYLLMMSLFWLCIKSYRNLRWRSAWQTLLQRRTAMLAGVIIVIYFVIAGLDSIHFHAERNNYFTETPSLLDKLFAQVLVDEESYSAPFATRSYTPSIVQLADGHYQRQYNPLHIQAGRSQNALEWQRYLYQQIIRGFMIAIISWLIFIVLFNFLLARYHHLNFFTQLRFLVQGKTRLAWRTMLVTIGIFLIGISLCSILSASYHLFGTDQVGHDVFYAAVKSIRTGLIIGTLTTFLMLPFALILGVIAGYFGGWWDDLIQYSYTTLSSIPGVLLISAAVLSLQIFMENHPQSFATLTLRADIRLLALCIILGITSWTTLCRLLRAETLKLREMDFVTAAVTLGAKPYQIILRHLLPNMLHIVFITWVLDFSGLVLAEAVLSYVGVGVDPMTFSWGNMINSARLELAREPVVWWPLSAAFIFMFILVLAANLLADNVRDAFDPRMHEVEER